MASRKSQLPTSLKVGPGAKSQAPFDIVQRPKHYTETDNGVECIDAIRAALGREQFIGFLRGQVIKYQWRLGKKGSSVEDNRKAIWYANKLDEVLNELEA
mgnify:CR=1 FL=1